MKIVGVMNYVVERSLPFSLNDKILMEVVRKVVSDIITMLYIKYFEGMRGVI